MILEFINSWVLHDDVTVREQGKPATLEYPFKI